MSLIVIVLQSGSLALVWLCILLGCWLLLSLLFDEQTGELLLAATCIGRYCHCGNGSFNNRTLVYKISYKRF